MYTMYAEVYEHTGSVSVLCMLPFTWKRLIGKLYRLVKASVKIRSQTPVVINTLWLLNNYLS